MAAAPAPSCAPPAMTETTTIHPWDTHRFTARGARLTGAIAAAFDCTNQEATHVLWECGFTMGTDRATWVNERHARRFLSSYRSGNS